MAVLNRQDKGVRVTYVGPVLMPGARYRMWWVSHPCTKLPGGGPKHLGRDFLGLALRDKNGLDFLLRVLRSPGKFLSKDTVCLICTVERSGSLRGERRRGRTGSWEAGEDLG